MCSEQQVDFVVKMSVLTASGKLAASGEAEPEQVE
jgi:hypothetical protein